MPVFFTPTVNITLPTPEHVRRSEPLYTRPTQKVVGLEHGLQNAVTAYFPAVETGKTRKTIDLNEASVQEVLNHFNLPCLERDNQRSDFINKFVADAARKLSPPTAPGEVWSCATTEQGRQAFEAAKERGDLLLKNRGKKKTGKRESEQEVICLMF